MKPSERRADKQQLIADLDRVGAVVQELYWHRFMFDRIMEIAEANPRVSAVPNDLWRFLHRIFGDSVSIAVRRVLDLKACERKTASLGTIITRLMKHPDVITRTEFAAGSLSNDLPANIRAGAFTRLGGPGEELDPNIWRCRLDHVRKKCRPVLERVDTRIAHCDRKPKRVRLEWEEFDDALEAIGELYCDLRLLLTQSRDAAMGTHLLKPSPSSYDSIQWTKVFEVPWIESPEHVPY